MSSVEGPPTPPSSQPSGPPATLGGGPARDPPPPPASSDRSPLRPASSSATPTTAMGPGGGGGVVPAPATTQTTQTTTGSTTPAHGDGASAGGDASEPPAVSVAAAPATTQTTTTQQGGAVPAAAGPQQQGQQQQPQQQQQHVTIAGVVPNNNATNNATTATKATTRDSGVYPGPDGKPVEIKDVWAASLEKEMACIRQLVEKYPYVAMDTEFPGVVAKPIGDAYATGYQYQTLQCNVDLLKIIQLGISFCDGDGKTPKDGACYCFQFNFRFDLSEDMYAEDSIQLLKESGIDFARHASEGIDVSKFGELVMMSGLVLRDDVKWISFHSGYDFGYLIKILTCQTLPSDERGFFDLLHTYFPVLYDVKLLMSCVDGLHGGLQRVAEDLKVERVGPMHQAGSDSMLTNATFFRLADLAFSGVERIEDKYRGEIYGLGAHAYRPSKHSGSAAQAAAVQQQQREQQQQQRGSDASNSVVADVQQLGGGVQMNPTINSSSSSSSNNNANTNNVVVPGVHNRLNNGRVGIHVPANTDAGQDANANGALGGMQTTLNGGAGHHLLAGLAGPGASRGGLAAMPHGLGGSQDDHMPGDM